ncbi:MAG TPA: tripartite tricarboxylate transporter substrate binding protein [Burkholderiales bacterium]|nr:tripartite tricarboxylate transporter substrate binding protein [Burkholderiales bacterium]
MIKIFNKNKYLCLFILFAVVLIAAHAAAQNYPSRPIRLIVPQSAGGSTDLVARPLAQRVADALKTSVVVDNRPGAGSTIGTDMAAKAPPDGYTLLAVAASFSMSPSLYKKLPFDPVNDFAPISLLSSLPNVLVVHPSQPIKSVKELIAYAKAQPGKLNYSSSGMATGTHMSMELLKHMTGIQMAHIPYKGGAPSVTALLSSEVQLCFATISTALPHVKSGRLRALAVSTARRATAAPEVPTIAESGVPGYDYASWIGLLAPAKTPAAIVAQWSAESARVMQTQDMKAQLLHEGSEPIGSSPQEFANIIRTEVARWKAVSKAAGIKAE